MFFYKLSGYRMSADEAYLIIRGLRTLDTRLNAHYENTKQVINFLRREKKIKESCQKGKEKTKEKVKEGCQERKEEK